MPTVDLSPPADILVAGPNAAAVGTLVASLRDQAAWRATSRGWQHAHLGARPRL
jgi:hypothetical protein